MNKTLKRVICICLCAVLMFGVFTAPIVQPKADAFAITATAGMIAIGVTLLTMLGITFATAYEAQQAVEQVVGVDPRAMKWLQDLEQSHNATGPNGEPEGGKWFKLGATTMAGLATFVNKARELFGNSANSGSVEVPSVKYGVYGHYVVYTGSDFTSAETAYTACFYGLNDVVNITVNGNNYSIYCDVSQGACLVGTSKDGGAFRYSIYDRSNNNPAFPVNDGCCRWGLRLYEYNGVKYLSPFRARSYINSESEVCYSYNQTLTDNFSNQLQYGKNYVPVSGDGIDTYYDKMPYQNISPYELNILYNALAEKLKTQEITFDYTDTLDQIENHSQEQLQVSQDQLLEQAQIKDLLEQIKAGQGGTTKTELQESDLNVPEVPHDLTWKFPFCVPFDLIALVGALNATPQDPKWQIPFHIESLSIDESIELDLTKFEPVTNVLRVVTTIAFLLGLIMVTRKMIKG